MLIFRCIFYCTIMTKTYTLCLYILQADIIVFIMSSYCVYICNFCPVISNYLYHLSFLSFTGCIMILVLCTSNFIIKWLVFFCCFFFFITISSTLNIRIIALLFWRYLLQLTSSHRRRITFSWIFCWKLLETKLLNV